MAKGVDGERDDRKQTYIRQLLCPCRRHHPQGAVAGGVCARSTGAGPADVQPHPAAGAAVQHAGGLLASGDAADSDGGASHLTPIGPPAARSPQSGEGEGTVRARAAWGFPRRRAWGRAAAGAGDGAGVRGDALPVVGRPGNGGVLRGGAAGGTHPAAARAYDRGAAAGVAEIAESGAKEAPLTPQAKVG